MVAPRSTGRILTIVAALLAVSTECAAHCPSLFAVPSHEVVECETAPPAEAVDRARRYLASVSSDSYQSEQFSLLAERTKARRRLSCDGEAVSWDLSFEYAPFRKVGADRPWFELLIPADPGCDVVGDVRLRSSDGTIVDPKITRDEAIVIAIRETAVDAGMAVEDAVLLMSGTGTGSGWRWNIDFKTRPDGFCQEGEMVEVDAISGELLSERSPDPFRPRKIERYPFVATDEKARLVRERFHEVSPGMTAAIVKNLLGEPDEVIPIHSSPTEGGKHIEHSYWYVLRRKQEQGSARDKDEELVRVSFDLDGKVTRVDHWGERASRPDSG